MKTKEDTLEHVSLGDHVQFRVTPVRVCACILLRLTYGSALLAGNERVCVCVHVTGLACFCVCTDASHCAHCHTCLVQ